MRAGIEQAEKETWFPGLFSENNWGPLSAANSLILYALRRGGAPSGEVPLRVIN